MLLLWIGGQALWLYFAFGLEHLGKNTFFQLWLSGIVFYLSQMGILGMFIRNKL
jgi:GPI mannosyltransferase 1 subunit M